VNELSTSPMTVTPSTCSNSSNNIQFNKNIQNCNIETHDDHNYLKTPTSRKRKRPMDEICEQTLTVLKEIGNNLPSIANAINRLTDVIDQKLN
jgi:hypothetical protein